VPEPPTTRPCWPLSKQVDAGGSNTVLLTRLGGGAFGNDEAWISDAIERALAVVEHAGLDIRLVSFGSVHPSMRTIAERWNRPSS
jgi:hypothetical protein